ncbi:MAG: M2 family metallopeptidase [Bryobacteraceae bacterium]|nr:M2 family metallopeptidase [Bryobacteraceae bacterium]
MSRSIGAVAAAACGLWLAGCNGAPEAGGAPAGGDAKKFVTEAEQKLLALNNESGRAQWVQATHITVDTEALSALANERTLSAAARFAKEAARFDESRQDPETARKLRLMKTGLVMATPADPKESLELTQVQARLEGMYGKGKFEVGGKALNIDDVTRIMAESRNPKELLQVWEGWHTISKPMKADYRRFVELSNKGAKELGFADTGAMWRSKYDMPPDDFARELDRLWEQVRPLYQQLHAYTRWKLRENYGDLVPKDGPIPGHLLGNVWAQQWDNLYPLLAPAAADPGYDLNAILKNRKTDAIGMVKYGEAFFTSMGFAPMPPTFWERSMFTRPRDREVVCHASAWDIDNEEDLRIKMCIEPTAEDFNTIHHELGHNIYQRAYNRQPALFRDSANDGFHEAIGDTIALSITPEYLKKIGLITSVPDPSKDTGLLLRRALDKIAFLPFGLLVDQWRWKVFSGQVPPEKYNEAWWELRRNYQGISAPSERPPDAFDPGAKYHVPGNTPYTRYFLAHLLQFQFHRALAETAGCRDPLHRCSVYGSKEAGAKLDAMLRMGISKPWPEALEKITGTRQMDANAIRDYFAPLEKWLKEQNAGKPVGW